jgi:hypothetical protein
MHKENKAMMNWYDMTRNNEVRHQYLLAEAFEYRLAGTPANQHTNIAQLRAWLAGVLREGARRLDNQFEAPRYEDRRKKAY